MNHPRGGLENERKSAAARRMPWSALCVAAIAAHAHAQSPPAQPAQPAPAQYPAPAQAQPAPAQPPPAQPPAAQPPAANGTAPAGAPATAPPAEPTQAQRDAARDAYARGQALFAQGNYPEAKAAFDQAYAALPNPVVLLSTAECQVRLNLLDDAYLTLQKYLADRPNAPDRAEVEQKAGELLAMPAHLLITTEPPGASVSLDGQATGKVTPADVEVKRGEHTVSLSLAGYEASSETIAARIGARHELQIALRAAAPSAVAPPPPTELKPETTTNAKPTTALWITSIIGAAGLVTGTVLGFMVLAERSDYDAHPTKASADRGERLALFTDVAFGVGAMALVTSAVLYLTSDQAAEPAHPAQSARIELLPAASAHGAALSARGHF